MVGVSGVDEGWIVKKLLPVVRIYESVCTFDASRAGEPFCLPVGRIAVNMKAVQLLTYLRS